jgi:hypothetical protein
MKNPFLKAPLFINIVVLLIAGIISSFTLLFGLAHLFEGIKQIIEGSGPEIPMGESLLGWTMVILLCILGVGTLFIAIAAIRAIYYRFSRK